MSIKHNLFYSMLLTMSTYLVPLLVFPYISRILGPEGVGAVDTVDNIIDYCVLLSTMGLSTIGIREIAKVKEDPEKLGKTFADLWVLHLISTALVFALLLIGMLFVPDLHQRYQLLLVGSVKLICNLFWVEWLFSGLEDFRYIALRSIVVRALFIVSVFLLVNQHDDYLLYYVLFVGITVLNAICNWQYKNRLFSYRLRDARVKTFLKPFLAIGVFGMLSAVYTKLSLPALGFICDDTEAGYYSTAIRFFQVIISMFTTLVGVMIPRISVLLEKGEIGMVRLYTKRAFLLLFALSLPAYAILFEWGADIIRLFAGEGFEGAILPMKIVMTLLFIAGAEKIVVLQLLIPLRADRAIVISGLIGALAWCVLTYCLVPAYASVGSAITWVVCETLVLAFASVAAIRKFREL